MAQDQVTVNVKLISGTSFSVTVEPGISIADVR